MLSCEGSGGVCMWSFWLLEGKLAEVKKPDIQEHTDFFVVS